MSAVTDIINSSEYKKIECDVENFVKEKLHLYDPKGISNKTIHDPVWGSVDYSDWEMQIIDSPLFQRLRDVNQVGLAMLTYPAARHSRFEHSLGVAAAAKLMCERIKKNSVQFSMEETERNAIILAALIHDIGHCFYSHLSETIYGELDDFSKLRKKIHEIMELKPKPHEILSFIIINTKTFKTFFFDHVDYPEKNKVSRTLFADVGCMVIGYNIKRGKDIFSYYTAIINGPFDSDKLDYIRRDSMTAGLALQYDIERLFTKLQVAKIVQGREIEHRLVINFNGITAIEELTFSKIMLFSYIYYHQKVLISETMIRDYVYGLYRLDIIKSFSDFLRYTDSDILKLSCQQEGKSPFPKHAGINLEELANNIRDRKLPRRCFEVTQTNIEPINTEVAEKTLHKHCTEIFNKLIKGEYSVEQLENDMVTGASIITRSEKVVLANLIGDLQGLTYTDTLDKRKEFFDSLVDEYEKRNLKVGFSLFDIYIVFPKLVSYGLGEDQIVLSKDRDNYMTINQFIKLDDWASSFNSNKWRGYVFVTDRIDKSIAFKVAEKLVLKGKAKIKNPSAYLKVDDC